MSKVPYQHWQYHHEEELNALINPEIKKIIDNNKIELISYQDFNLV